MVHVRPISRRAALQAAMLAAGAAALGTVTSCGAETTAVGAGASTTTTAESPAADTDIAMLNSAVGAEADLLELCSTVRRRHPELRSLVTPVVTTQRAHVQRLTDVLAEPPSFASPPKTTVPPGRQGALTALTAAFSAAEQDRLADCLGATSGLLARLFASVSASHAVTVETVRAAR